MGNINEMREDYASAGLERGDLHPDPINQFKTWFNEAIEAKIPEANAMILSTVSQENSPSQRTVLLKEFDQNGFRFFTNYQSNKALDMENNQHVSILFPWIQIQRQVIVSGQVEKITRSETEKYFKSRPRGSQLGAWVSKQSTIINSREVLNSELTELTQKFKGQEIPTPEHWGGYLIRPEKIEFWQGRTNRLHDRFVYYKNEDSVWDINRLSP